jgi:hypothetical protein
MPVAARVRPFVMIDVNYLHYGKLVSVEGWPQASNALGVTRRSTGLLPEDDADLRINALLEMPVFNASMVDPAVADRGALFIRTLQKKRRTVFVRARFRREGEDSSDSRVHQQATVWVVDSHDWENHPAAIIQEVRKGLLGAEPDRTDDFERFKRPALQAPMQAPPDVEDPDWSGRTRHEEACYRIADTLYESSWNTAPRDRAAFFNSDDFATEDDFLDVLAKALHKVAHNPNGRRRRWADIRIGSGLRPQPGGLVIGYLPSDAHIERREFDGVEAVRRRLGERQRRAHLHGTGRLDGALKLAPTPDPNPDLAVSPEVSPHPQVPEKNPEGWQSSASQANHYEARRQQAPEIANPRQGFSRALATYRRRPDEATAAALRDAAENLRKSRISPDREEANAYCAVLGALEPAASDGLPLGTIYDRALFSTHLGDSYLKRLWKDALAAAVVRAGVLFPVEVRRHISIAPLDLPEVERASLALNTWLSGHGNQNPANPCFYSKLVERIDMLAESHANLDSGIHGEILVARDGIMGGKEIDAMRATLLRYLLKQAARLAKPI